MKQLRDYQLKIVTDIITNYSRVKGQVIVLPTGAGKSLLGGYLMKNKADYGQQSIWFVDRRKLVKQTVDAFNQDLDLECGVIMHGERLNKQALAHIASTQSFKSWLKKDNTFIHSLNPTLIICDECHLRTGFQYEIKKQFPNANIIGLTATPITSGEYYLGEVYNKLLAPISMSELIEQKFLVPANYYAPTLPDLNDIKLSNGDYDPHQLGERMSKPKIVGDIIEHWLKHADSRPSVAFCASIAQSRYLASEFNKRGVKAAHMDCYDDEGVRESILAQSKSGDVQVICNVALLSYGWDAPHISCMILARPTKSEALYLQMLGRGLRTANGKSDLLVLDHAGATYEHGFAEQARKWDLFKGQKKAASLFDFGLEAEEKVIKPRICKCCSFVFEKLPACPKCGELVSRYMADIVVKEGQLEAVKTLKHKSTKAVIHQDVFASELKGYAAQKGKGNGWIQWCYGERYKGTRIENLAQLEAKEPSQLTISYIKHINIRFARRKQKEAIIKSL